MIIQRRSKHDYRIGIGFQLSRESGIDIFLISYFHISSRPCIRILRITQAPIQGKCIAVINMGGIDNIARHHHLGSSGQFGKFRSQCFGKNRFRSICSGHQPFSVNRIAFVPHVEPQSGSHPVVDYFASRYIPYDKSRMTIFAQIGIRTSVCRSCQFYQSQSHGYFLFRSFGERNSYGIPYAFIQKSTYPYGRTYPPVFSLPRFGYPQMKGIIHRLLFHSAYEQSHSLNHNSAIAGLQRNNHVVKILRFAKAQIFHSGFHHSLRGISETGRNPAGKRTVVGTYAQGFSSRLAYSNEFPDFNFYAFEFPCIFRFVVRSPASYEITRINPYLIRIQSRRHCSLGHKMNVRTQRNVVSVRSKPGLYIPNIFSLFHALGRYTHHFSSGIRNPLGLFDTSLRIQCIGIQHGLYEYGTTGRNNLTAYANLNRMSSNFLNHHLKTGNGIP